MAAPDIAEFPYVALRTLSLNGVTAHTRGDYIAVNSVGVTGTDTTEAEWVLGEDYAERESEAADEAITGPQRPADGASKAAWVDYAVALHDAGEPFGLDRDAADALTRDQLRAHTAGEAG